MLLPLGIVDVIAGLIMFTAFGRKLFIVGLFEFSDNILEAGRTYVIPDEICGLRNIGNLLVARREVGIDIPVNINTSSIYEGLIQITNKIRNII